MNVLSDLSWEAQSLVIDRFWLLAGNLLLNRQGEIEFFLPKELQC